MLETEISPIFGLTLVNMVDLLALAGLLTAAFTALYLYISAYRRGKTESAHLSLKLLEMGKNDDKIINALKKIDSTKKIDDNEAHDLLRYYEFIAEFWKDRVLSYDHVLHVHGKNLKKMYHHNDIKTAFEHSVNEQPKYNYLNLQSLFLKINDDL